MRQTFFEINGQRFDDDIYFHLTRVAWQDSPAFLSDTGDTIIWPGWMLFEFWKGGTGNNGLGRDGYVFQFPSILAGEHNNKPFLIVQRLVRYVDNMESVGGTRLNTIGAYYFKIHLTEMDEPKQMLVSAAVDWLGGRLRYNSEVP